MPKFLPASPDVPLAPGEYIPPAAALLLPADDPALPAVCSHVAGARMSNALGEMARLDLLGIILCPFATFWVLYSLVSRATVHLLAS